MITPELKSYIQAEIERGVAKTDLKKALVDAGWPADDVEQGLNPGSKPAIAVEPFPVITSNPAASDAGFDPSGDMTAIFSDQAPVEVSGNKFQAVKAKLSAFASNLVKQVRSKIPRKKSSAVTQESPFSSIPAEAAAAITSAAPENVSAKPGFKERIAALRAHPRFKKGLAAALASILLLIGAGAGAFVYLRSPARLVSQMMKNLSGVQSMEYNATLKASGPGGALSGLSAGGIGLAMPAQGGMPAIGEISLNLNGAGDFLDLNNPKFKFATNISAAGLNEGKPMGFDMIGLQSAFYFKVNNVSEIAGFDLKPLSDQWISIIQPAGGPARQPLTPDEISDLKKTIRKARILKIEEELAGENLNGVDTRRFKVTLDKDGLKKLAADMSKESYGSKMNKKKIEDFEKSVESKPLPDGEIWIGRDDSMPYKLLIRFKEQNPASLTLAFNRFNQPLQIDAPAQSKPFQDVIMMVMSGGLKSKTAAAKKDEKAVSGKAASALAKSAPAAASAAAQAPLAVQARGAETDDYGNAKGSGNPNLDTDGDGLDDEMESMLGTNPRKQDTDGDGVKDGAEVKRGEDPTSRN